MGKIEQLRDRVEELEGLLGLNLKLPNEFGLTPMEMKYVGLLVRRDIASREMLYNAIYGGDSERDAKNIDVHICKIRRKLSPKGVSIKNRFGVGYYMDAESRAALKDLVAA